MMKTLLPLALVASFALGFATTTAVRADETTQHFNISVWNAITQAYPVTGSMDLTYHPDGVVTGWYHPADLPSFIPIQGGRNGNNVWLTIGLKGDWQLSGQLTSTGGIAGTAYSTTPSRYSNSIREFGAPLSLIGASGFYDFVATPKESSYGP
jgi:hypothetical protein